MITDVVLIGIHVIVMCLKFAKDNSIVDITFTEWLVISVGTQDERQQPEKYLPVLWQNVAVRMPTRAESYSPIDIGLPR